MHYARWKAHGDPHQTAYLRNTPDLDRFWFHVDKSDLDGCWPWTARRNNKGYGSFTPHGCLPVSAHRYAYATSVGPIPDGHLVRHTCDNPPCVRPDHLLTGTASDNMRDAVERGRANSAPGREARRLVQISATHCKHGHEFTSENTYVYQGRRKCRACNVVRAAAYRERKRA